jgi:tRNA/rRNA methyltransferase
VTVRLDIVLVRPKEDGNIGAVARVARNFGAERLTLVAARAKVGTEAERRAMGGRAILKKARKFPSLNAAVKDADLVIGTTDMSTGRSNNYLRRSVSPERLGELLTTLTGRVALVFGPEDNGLSRTELARCDLLVHIPARREFPTLNLSHAAAIVLYAVHRARGPTDPETTPAPEEVLLNGTEKELFLTRVEELLTRTGYPPHKRRSLILLFRRAFGRSAPSEAEYRMMLGLFKSFEHALNRKKIHG